jgi:hypothetical protein
MDDKEVFMGRFGTRTARVPAVTKLITHIQRSEGDAGEMVNIPDLWEWLFRAQTAGIGSAYLDGMERLIDMPGPHAIPTSHPSCVTISTAIRRRFFLTEGTARVEETTPPFSTKKRVEI